MQNPMLQDSQNNLVNESEQESLKQAQIAANSVPQKVHNTVYYQITSDKSFMKGVKYYLSKDNQILYMAKAKDDEILIFKGSDFNSNENQLEYVAKVNRTKNGYNIVNTGDQEFKVNFIQIGNYNSLNVSFKHNGEQLFWIPRQPKSKIGLNGGYGRAPIQSKKNTMLQNLKQRPSFICREMPKKVFEAECNKNIDPVIPFAIALSQIIGPLSK